MVNDQKVMVDDQKVMVNDQKVMVRSWLAEMCFFLGFSF
jgi:hypothetical protein